MIKILFALFFLAGCSHKMIGKNCMQAEESEFYVCDTLSATGN